MTSRLRCCKPLPQVTLHLDQGEKADTSQCTGHGPILHALSSCWCAHLFPPCCASIAMPRMRCCLPRPQVRSQMLHSLNGIITQWTGQALAPHLRTCFIAGHTIPPNRAGRFSMRERVCEPPPQLASQELQGPKIETSQSTGQLSSAHGRCSKSFGHTAPP